MQALNHYQLHTASGRPVKVSEFGMVPYQESFTRMSEFALNRHAGEEDQIWLLQHPPVYTQGTACSQKTHTISDIAVIKSDRGGQITYHGPGQIVMYPLLKLKDHNLGIKSLVANLEQSVIELLESYQIKSDRRQDAPGVYVNDAKISALGLRIKRGTSYHGLSFNVDMDLKPFANIDPCGYQGLPITQFSELYDQVDFDVLSKQLVKKFVSLI